MRTIEYQSHLEQNFVHYTREITVILIMINNSIDLDGSATFFYAALHFACLAAAQPSQCSISLIYPAIHKLNHQ